MAFKDVVRNAYGPSSKQYRRIHVRDDGSSGGGGDGGRGGSGGGNGGGEDTPT
jgi:hypothetical protein